MAIANRKELIDLLQKTENEGTTAQGRLTAHEWNSLVDHVIDTNNMANGSIKGIKYNDVQVFDEIDENGYLKMNVADNSGYKLISTVTPPPAYIARNSECIIKLTVMNKRQQGNTDISVATPCTVKFFLNNENNAFYTGQVYDIDSTKPDAVKELVVDISKISGLNLDTSENDNIIRIEVNNQLGRIDLQAVSFKVIDLGLEVETFNNKKIFTDKAGDEPVLRATVTGTDGTIVAFVDGEELATKYCEAGSREMVANSDLFKTKGFNTQGVHTLEVKAVVTRTSDTETITIETPIQKFNYIFGESSLEKDPVVMAVISDNKPKEYSNFELSYIAYNFSGSNTIVTDKVNISICDISYDTDNNVIIDTTYLNVEQEVAFENNKGSGSVIFSLFPVNNVSLKGEKAVVISIGEYKHVTNIEIIESDVKLTQLSNYAVYLTANNRSNNEPADTVNKWVSIGKDIHDKVLEVEVDFDDNIEFMDSGSGWKTDSEGNMALHLRKGRFCTLKYAPFDVNPTYNDGSNQGNELGKTISIEFATRNCLNQNSTVIECLDNSNGNERGFIVTAASAILKSNNFDLGIEFKEETRIRIDFVIEGKLTDYSYDTVTKDEVTGDQVVKQGTSPEALAIIYVDGVYQGLKVIPENTSFLQGNKKDVEPSHIRFGSNDCDLDIYNIRIYDQALNPTQIINNYAYDTPNIKEKFAIATRNDIFEPTGIANKPNINIVKLRNALPKLPFFFVQQPSETAENGMIVDAKLPWNKSDWLKVPFTEWKNPANEDNTLDAAVSWTTEKGRWRNQGTSSMSYPWPWRNWDWQLKYDKDKNEIPFTFGDGSTGDKWAQYKGMSRAGNIKKITLKKDYASSEMCNNAITSEYFTDMALAIGNEFPGVLSPAQRIEGPDTTPYRLTFIATPCFLFQKFNNANKQGTGGDGYEALGMMNLIPNKNECDYLGFGKSSGFAWGEDGTKFDEAQSWELTDNKDGWFWYTKLNGVDRNDDGTFTNDLAECYEARYPKDTTVFKNSEGEFDGDFGLIPDGKSTIEETEYEDLKNEQKHIIDFHNWLVDVNRQIPVDYYNEVIDEAGNIRGEYRNLTDKELVDSAEWNKNKDGGILYTKDEPDYRLAKFKAEAPTRLIIDQFCLYYIWRETFWAFDSGFKNLQVYTMGKANEYVDYCQWGCMVRDADTTLGIDNLGVKKFPPHLEDIDYMVEHGDGTITFNYGGAKNMYHLTSVDKAGGKTVLNGQLGSLWINLRDAFGEEIHKIYKSLVAASKANWKAGAAIKRFRDHQEKWCENLYNFGMRQYFGGGPFTTWINSGLGDKKNSRANWLSKGFYYRNSKYNTLGEGDYCKVRASTYSTPDNIEGLVTVGNVSRVTAEVPLKWKTYIPMYVGLGASEELMSACKNYIRVTDIDNTFDVLPGAKGLDFPYGTDQNTWFYGTSQLTEIGDLARCVKINEFAKIALPKLRELNLGHEPDRTLVNGIECAEGTTYYEYYTDGDVQRRRPIQNDKLTAMDCSTLSQLTILDVTNHKLLNAINELNKCDQLQELYAKGTDALKSITLPNTTSLKVLYLGKNLVTLNLTNLTGIEKFVLEGYDELTKLYIRNCGNYMSGRSYEIVRDAISSLERAYNPNNVDVCQLTGINWQNADVEIIERLVNINATLSGKINITTGTLSSELKAKLVAKYDAIDSESNGLYITYPKTPITSVSMPSKLYIYNPGDTQLTFTINPSNANTFKKATWSISDTTYAYINEATGVLTRRDIEADETVGPAEVTVTIEQLTGGVKEAKTKIYFYERDAKVGDIVFNDGSYSDELDPTKTPIGVCFYIDPNDKTKRLMCALRNLQDSYLWGVRYGGKASSGDTEYWIGSPKYLNFEGTYDASAPKVDKWCYDIQKIDNIEVGQKGLGPSMAPSELVPSQDSWFCDAIFRTNNGGFNLHTNNYSNSKFSQIGWKKAKNDISIDIDNISINKDDNIPIGYYNTLAIIEHRNRLLDAYHKVNEDQFHIPRENENETEMANLNTYITDANNWFYAERTAKLDGSNGTYGSLMYYPAASSCYAYEPDLTSSNNELDPKFKKHNWFLPATGEMLRILYYYYQSYNDDNNKICINENRNSIHTNANAFANAIQLGILSINEMKDVYNNPYRYCTSTENNYNYSSYQQNYYADYIDYVCPVTGNVFDATVDFISGSSISYNKSSVYKVRPICMF